MLRQKLINAVTQYDKQQSTRRGYNSNALPQYFAAIDKAIELSNEMSLEKALRAYFCDRLLSVCLKAIKD